MVTPTKTHSGNGQGKCHTGPVADGLLKRGRRSAGLNPTDTPEGGKPMLLQSGKTEITGINSVCNQLDSE